ncbi:hypothetical protein MEJ65_00845 [Candidatus Carsonella ruddii]|uniref:Uncharacterized protein n=1 Tax=Carsonella ruddii TaxID=114186 RepID=A0AAJ6FDN1_CARRU|nr:hypothetical protein [Candidatus Carsonella ruddii]WGS66617.1 hypothetical protein MEJ66_00855 [Candidatus Carsonella ruddii]WGS66814.1 hypothetical protein MEJ62_00835 [Candidatus Carsonella ruddii]WGS67006.1 hypothetical protein MEJ60_00840 [Candidatus Carsonella ruddii]WGS67197.1 hypothetical protein MEJ65_00845 [Candidatus Carsonella ruddii]WMC18214.1 MAG: hypothetical protein NU472_00855 [Candidatus Carsonella ruddii]
MKKNLILIIYNKINSSSNFFNYLIQINIKIKILKIKKFYKNNIKILIIDDCYLKINQFLKSLSKCLFIKKIFSYKKIKTMCYNKLYYFKNIKILKNFIFLSYIKKYIFFFNIKKNNYVKSIMNIFHNNIYL